MGYNYAQSNNQATTPFTNFNMSKSTIFNTGATGFIGAQITAFALRAGFNVKLSVRREAQIDSLRQAFSGSRLI
jgi:NADP-dependent 3-hydroxy acid dehydrogenase YdfG